MTQIQHLGSGINNTRNIESRRNETLIQNNNDFANVYQSQVEGRTEQTAVDSQIRA